MPGLVQITSPPLSSALTSLATAKNDLNQADVYADDAYITALIDRASSVVSAYCGRTFGKQTVAESFRITGRSSPAVAAFGTPMSPTGYNAAILSCIPVISITSVVEGGVTLTSADYEYDANTGAIWRVFSGIRSSWMSLSAIITYIGGYVLPTDTGTRTLPPAIEEVALSLVRGAYYSRGGDPHIQSEQVEGVGRNIYSQTAPMSGMEIDTNSARILAPYRARVW